ncbi:MAG: 8-amino-7-oxononanoate synthase [Nitrospinae bacterium]|nr:8-amino-7-oxononanoate synthase [Nitrospinota bacterium]
MRSFKTVVNSTGRTAVINGREVLMFGSNDYLGLSRHPEVVKAVAGHVEKHGFGAGSSRLVCGNTAAHEEFESQIAAYLGKPAALTFNSGYSANVGTLTALLGKGDVVFADRLCHASILDGIRWSGAKLVRFVHNDADSLRSLMLKHGSRRGKSLVVTEGVFSMDGDKGRLLEIGRVAKEHGAIYMVDDAHGVGVFGPDGRGTIHEAGAAELVDIHIITLGKAFGGTGGVVAGSKSLIDGLVNFSRSFVYSTGIPPAAAVGAMAALNVIKSDEGKKLRSKIMTNMEKVVYCFKNACYISVSCASQIIPVPWVDDKDLASAGDRLLELGVFAPAIRPPTVPKGTGRFRVSITSDHTEQDIAKAASAFGRILTGQGD